MNKIEEVVRDALASRVDNTGEEVVEVAVTRRDKLANGKPGWEIVYRTERMRSEVPDHVRMQIDESGDVQIIPAS